MNGATRRVLVPVLALLIGTGFGIAIDVRRLRRTRRSMEADADRNYRRVMQIAIGLVDRVLLDGDEDAYARLSRLSAQS